MKYVPTMDLAALKRFWSKVDITGLDDCWAWTGYRLPKGYGTFGIGCQKYLAHRVAYAVTHGKPGELLVCHHCDSPWCVNPAHLFLGTHVDNNRDCHRKGRASKVRAYGVKHGRTKLTADDVRDIRASADLQRVIAKRYGIHQQAVSRLQRGESWKYLDA